MEFNVGLKIKTKQDYWITIVEVINWNKYVVRFDNGFELNNVTKRALESRNIGYPFHPTVFGVGFIGVGKYKTTNNKGYRELHKAYAIWQMMIGRCYCPKIKQRQPNYHNLTVHPRWLNYQIFAKWFEENYIEGFDFSRNVLQPQSKVYSEDTCCFVPNEIKNTLIYPKRKKHDLPISVMPAGNRFATNIGRLGEVKHLGFYDTADDAFKEYKKEKEKYMKFLANKWRPQLKPETYDALMNFEFIKMY